MITYQSEIRNAETQPFQSTAIFNETSIKKKHPKKKENNINIQEEGQEATCFKQFKTSAQMGLSLH